jgi:hypothetical protein
MTQQVSYIELLTKLTPFHFHIFSTVKKDCKSEHLAIDSQFLKKHFPGKVAAKITTDDLVAIYPKVINEGHEQLAEFIANRWLLKHMDTYHFFEEELKKINPKFDQIIEISVNEADDILHRALEETNPINCYIFCVLNSVAFPSHIIKSLEEKALSCVTMSTKAQEEEKENIDAQYGMKEVQKICDRYEKKLSGMQKKYVKDTASLQKKVTSLQP